MTTSPGGAPKSVSDDRPPVLINVDKIAEAATYHGSNCLADTVQRLEHHHHHHHHHQYPQPHQYPYTPWDSLRTQSLSRLETFVSTASGAVLGGRRFHDDAHGDSFADCKDFAEDLRLPKVVCPCSRSGKGRLRTGPRIPSRCPSFPHLTTASCGRGKSPSNPTLILLADDDVPMDAASFVACDDSSCCCCCQCCCCCDSSSVDVDASSMSPRLSSNVDLSQDLEMDIQLNAPSSTCESRQRDRSRDRSRLTTSSSVNVESSSSSLDQSVSVLAAGFSGNLEAPNIGGADASLPPTGKVAAAEMIGGRPVAMETTLSSSGDDADDHTGCCSAANVQNDAPLQASTQSSWFPVTWASRRSISCPSLSAGSSHVLQSQQQVSGDKHQTSVQQSSLAARRRRSHVTAAEVSLEGEVVNDLPVAVRPGANFPDFNPEMEVGRAAANESLQTSAGGGYPACIAAARQLVKGQSARAQSSCVRLRRQTMATSGDVRTKCLQWLNGLNMDGNNCNVAQY